MQNAVQGESINIVQLIEYCAKHSIIFLKMEANLLFIFENRHSLEREEERIQIELLSVS